MIYPRHAYRHVGIIKLLIYYICKMYVHFLIFTVTIKQWQYNKMVLQLNLVIHVLYNYYYFSTSNHTR